MATNSPSDSFTLDTTGYIQGNYEDDPTTKNWMLTGVVDPDATQPFWGGVAVSELIPTIDQNNKPNTLKLATSNSAVTTGIMGFTVFNQANNMILVSGSSVQQALAGMNISYFRLKSNARIPVKCDAGLAAALDNGGTNQQVSWDLQRQMLVPYTPGYASNAVTGAVWASTAGGQVTFTVTTDPTSALNAGDIIVTSGIVNTGGSSTGAFNGFWTVVSVTSTTIVVSAPASASIGTFASNGLVQSTAAGALACTVINVSSSSKVVNYNSTTGALNYEQGAVAVIQI